MIPEFRIPGNRSTARDLVSIGDVGTQAFLERDDAKLSGEVAAGCIRLTIVE
jgi:hypothetical protein